MKKFVPSMHTRPWSWKEYMLAWMSVLVAMVILVFKGNDCDLLSNLKRLSAIALIWSLPLFLVWLCDRYMPTRGVIIQEETLLWKGFWKKSIDPQSITAIKITQASSRRRHRPFPLMKDENGNQLYSMFLLKIYMPWVMNEKEGQEMQCDEDFCIWGREYIICRLVYDQEVIDYLLRLNPDIVVF